MYMLFSCYSDTCSLSSQAYSRYPSSSGPCCNGHGGNLWPLRQSVFAARQKEEVRDQSSAQEFMPCLQWDFHLQGIMCPKSSLHWPVVVCVLFVLSLVSMSLSQLVLVFQVVGDISLFTLMRQKCGPCLYFPSSLVCHSLNGVCQGIPSQKDCLLSLNVCLIVWNYKCCFI